ncbi:MAG: tetratricopeptide repeat protein [Candidatus Fermentibacteraceae bacterium]|nr:tetratricopeptide repeat protein [Candidatus Fermentibacteraceae bacterium]
MLNVVPRPVQQLLLNGMDSSLGEGIVLFADISGFTSITESLLEHGRKGADVLSRILNGIFSRAVDYTYGYGGEIADFEGDAIIAVFPSYRPEMALHAAMSLKRFFHGRPEWKTDLGRWPVSARISLASGNLEWRIIGSDRLAFYLGGTAVARAAGLSAGGLSNTVACHDSYSNLVKRELGIYPEELEFDGSCRSRIGSGRIRRSTAGRFVSEVIVSSRLSGEFRTVTPVFLHLAGEDFAQLRSYSQQVLEAATLYGGEVSGFFASDRSYITCLVLFGAPVAWENNNERAFDFTLQLLDGLGGSFRAGISSGTAYAGIVGDSRRCRYSVYGDTVNTAARLAMKARFGEILVTDTASAGNGRSHLLSGSRRWLPRGKSEDILIHRLESTGSRDSGCSYVGKMLGRNGEADELLEALKPLESGSSAGLTVVCGEPGMGKSRLIFEVVKRLGPDFQSFVLRCDDILRKSLNPFVYFLRELFHQSESKDSLQNRRAFEERIRFLLREIRESPRTDGDTISKELERASSIIGALLGHHWPDSVYSRLAPESVMDNTILSLNTLITALTILGPLILIIEDMQWMDRDSRSALWSITANALNIPLGILVSSRYADDGSTLPVPAKPSVTGQLHLRGIDEDSAAGIIEDRLGAPPDKRLSEFIIGSSAGNPFYIEQFCMYLLESGQIRLDCGTYRLSGSEIEIPSGIRAILVARMDRLPNRIRKFMQTASVLGQEWSAETLQMISGQSEECDLIDEGQRLQLWSRQSGSIFSFNHALYRDTAYGMLLGKSLSKLHSRAADVLIELHRNDPEPVAGEIAIHLRESRQMARAVDWGWRALCHALDNYRNTDVIQWSDRLRDWMMADDSEGNRNPLLLDVLLKRDAVLHSLGRRDDQRGNLELMDSLAGSESWTHRTAEILKARGTYAWSIGEVDEAFGLFNRGLDFTRRSMDEAIRGKLLGNIANIHAARGRFDDAQKYYDLALGIHRGLGDRKQEGITLGNLAILLRRSGDDERARRCYEKALSIHRSSGNRMGEVRILCGLGNLEDKPEDALRYYMEALTINREIGDRCNDAIILGNLGRLETADGNYDRASKYLDEALGIHRQIGNAAGEADIHCLIGEMYYFMSHWSEARKHFTRAIELSEKTGNSRQECIYQGLLGLASFEDGALEEAAKCYTDCYRLIMEYGFPTSIDDSLPMLREKLLDSGTDPHELPFPDHWGCQS